MILRSASIISRSWRKGTGGVVVIFPRLAGRGGGGASNSQHFLLGGGREGLNKSCCELILQRFSSSFNSPPLAASLAATHHQNATAAKRIRPHRHEKNHSTSAAAAAVVSEEEEEEEVMADDDNHVQENEEEKEDATTTTTREVKVHKHTTTTTTITTNTPRKPRLQALREQLRKEPKPTSFLESSSGSPATKQQPQVIHWKELLKRSSQTQLLLQKKKKKKKPVVNGQGGGGAAAAAILPLIQEQEEEQKQKQQPEGSVDDVLTDRFGRHHNYLRISLAERCNLRCTYCMPPEGVPLQPQSNLLQIDEILLLAQHFQNHGVNKIRLTGGEPTLRKDLVQILQGLRDMERNNNTNSNNNNGGGGGGGFDELAITTNGVTLAKNLESYVQAGLNRVNISLDTLHPEKFATLTRRPAAYYHKVWEAIEMAATQYTTEELVTKINVVVMKGINDDEIMNFCNLQRQFPNLHIRFIEYMPFTENGWNMDKWVPYRDLLEQLQTRKQNQHGGGGGDDCGGDGVHLIRLPESDPNDTTKWYTTLENYQKQQQQQQVHGVDDCSSKDGYTSSDGGTTTQQEQQQQSPPIGKIGFITSMSQPFCGTCNRLRLTSDGQIKVCLFDGNSTISLRDAIREGANAKDLDLLIQHALQKKHYSLGGHTSPEHILQDSDSNRPMTLIGG